MRLGLRRPVKAIAVAALVAAAGRGAVATAVVQPGSWTVTVGDASRPLYPGTDASMPYDVQNGSSGVLHLHGTTAAVHLKNPAEGCRAEWFHIDSNSVPTDIEVAPGGTVHGSLALAFDSVPASQEACQNTGIEVVVTAS